MKERRTSNVEHRTSNKTPFSAPIIVSERLLLAPLVPDVLRDSLDGNLKRAEQLLGFSLPEDWPGELSHVITRRLQELEQTPSLQAWLHRAMVLQETQKVIGTIGFHTAPDADYLQPYCRHAVEFGFTVFPSFRRRGYAREAALALMQWARQNHGIRDFILSIRPDNLPSQGLAAGLGFVRISSHVDEVDGLEDILHYKLPD